MKPWIISVSRVAVKIIDKDRSLWGTLRNGLLSLLRRTTFLSLWKLKNLPKPSTFTWRYFYYDYNMKLLGLLFLLAKADRHNAIDQLTSLTQDSFSIIDEFFESSSNVQKNQWKTFLKRKRGQLVKLLSDKRYFIVNQIAPIVSNLATAERLSFIYFH